MEIIDRKIYISFGIENLISLMFEQQWTHNTRQSGNKISRVDGCAE